MTNARDPVCGMTVNQGTAVRSTHEGEAFYFCSERCRVEFDGAPGRWAARSRDEAPQALRADEMEKHEQPFTTRGGITAPKFGAAGSGGAEYERLPEKHD